MSNLLNIILSLRSSIRRRYLVWFRKEYVRKKLAERKGNCEGCGGICCKRTRPCPFLKNGKCSIYKTKIPKFCKIFPIDEEDIRLAGVADVCRYYWKKN